MLGKSYHNFLVDYSNLFTICGENAARSHYLVARQNREQVLKESRRGKDLYTMQHSVGGNEILASAGFSKGGSKNISIPKWGNNECISGQAGLFFPVAKISCHYVGGTGCRVRRHRHQSAVC